MKKISKANTIVVIISIILLISILGIVGYKYYEANKNDDSNYIITKVNKILNK